MTKQASTADGEWGPDPVHSASDNPVEGTQERRSEQGSLCDADQAPASTEVQAGKVALGATESGPASPDQEPKVGTGQASFNDADPAPAACPTGPAAKAPRAVDRKGWGRIHRGNAVGNEGDDFTFWRRLWALLTGPATIALFALMVGLVGFFFTTRIIELYATLAALSAWEAWCAVVLIGLSVLAVLGSVAYFALIYLRLRANRQIQLDELNELSFRANLRRQDSVESIVSYLRGYSLAEDGVSFPLDEAAHRGLSEAKRRLLDEWWPRMKHIPDQWLERYVEVFQSPLDEVAGGRVRLAASMVAFKTAVSPNPLLDSAIVLFWSFKLLGDLCRIYNLRVGAFGTIALLCRVFFVAYVAGRMDEWEEHTEESLEDALEYVPLPDLARSIVGRVGAKSGAGLANYFLLRRLGRRAIEMLRPVRP